MKRFNCLAEHLPLFGPHLLEASAGTGKTFSIEHIFVRLILQKVPLDKILAVTFTRAATRELKMRIRENLEKALQALKSNNPIWEYLDFYLESSESLQLLEDALNSFDQAQIFTIHGFCYRMLQEFAFEAKVGFLPSPDQGKSPPESLQWAASDFLENGVEENLLSAEQMSLVLKKFDSQKALELSLVKEEKDIGSTRTFLELFSECKAALHSWSGETVEEEKLLEDFKALEGNYKKMPGNFLCQVSALAHPESSRHFAKLLKERGSLFSFLSPKNEKVRTKAISQLNYPGFFDWAAKIIGELLQEDPLLVLKSAWAPVKQKVLEEEDYFDPDAILNQMNRCLDQKDLLGKIRDKYEAAIIDEFQDTDAVQWEVFQKLFIQEPIRALYLVGDPKQSIYRFRKADIYTYLKAKNQLGLDNVYHLDTNYRSSKPLVEALNALFDRQWLHLPKVQQTIEFIPVQAGAATSSDFSDGKGAIHCFIAKAEPSRAFEEMFIPLAVREIEALSLKSCAILVRDRHQIEKVVTFLKKRGIPVVSKSHIPLGQTEAFQSVCELFNAILDPKDAMAKKIFEKGPFYKPDLKLTHLRTVLEEKGLTELARMFDLDSDASQIFELLFAFEQKEGFSIAGLKNTLKQIQQLDTENGGRRRTEINSEAVQVMTLHISKGLEFDVVFALGLTARTPLGEDEIEEMNAEKMRQLYVAMTRAKKRLYIPIVQSDSQAPDGKQSPMELFSNFFSGSIIDELETLASEHSLTNEYVSGSVELGPSIQWEGLLEAPLIQAPLPFKPCYLSSFTALAKTTLDPLNWVETEGVDLQTMPRGAETGILIHSIFEQIFGSQKPIWCEENLVLEIVKEKVRRSILEPWQHVIEEMVLDTIQRPLFSNFSLKTLLPKDVQVEMEFIFEGKRDFIKGFVDLIFRHENQIYFLDWKTNWLESYDPQSIERCMKVHDYGLQATLYSEAIERHFQSKVQGAFYFFIRGKTFSFLEKFERFD